MKNIIFFLLIFLTGIIQNIFCAEDNIVAIVVQLSQIPLHDYDHRANFNLFYGSLDKKMPVHQRSYQSHLNELIKEDLTLVSEEEYVFSVYKYFRLLYDNDVRKDVDSWESKTAYELINSYICGKGLLKKIYPLLNQFGKRILKDVEKLPKNFEQNDKEYKKIIKDDPIPILNSLKLINKFFLETPVKVWQRGDLIFSEALINGNKNDNYNASFSALFESISQPLYKDKKTVIEYILYTVKKMENEMLWRGLLFYFDPYQQLTLEYVKNFFNEAKFQGKQFKDIKILNDIPILINDRIKFFSKKLKEFSRADEHHPILEKNAAPFFFAKQLFQDDLGLWGSWKKVEIENLNLRINTLKELLKDYNNLPEVKFNKKIKIGLCIAIFSILGGGIIYHLKQKTHSLDPRMWWQKFRNR